MPEWRLTKSIPDVEASSDGELRVIPHEVQMPNGGVRTYGGQATRGQWDGTRFIYFRQGRTYRVARLVCEAFHGQAPADKNNRPTNLKWGTQRENLNMPGFLAYCAGRTGPNNPFIKGRKT